jgi:hypothetical protein
MLNVNLYHHRVWIGHAIQGKVMDLADHFVPQLVLALVVVVIIGHGAGAI